MWPGRRNQSVLGYNFIIERPKSKKFCLTVAETKVALVHFGHQASVFPSPVTSGGQSDLRLLESQTITPKLLECKQQGIESCLLLSLEQSASVVATSLRWSKDSFSFCCNPLAAVLLGLDFDKSFFSEWLVRLRSTSKGLSQAGRTARYTD